jgi:hypothetical protein
MNREEDNMPKPKKEAPIKTVEGLQIYIKKRPSKTGIGRDRITVSVRQTGSKKWRLAASLCYVTAFDIRFEKPTSRKQHG